MKEKDILKIFKKYSKSKRSCYCFLLKILNRIDKEAYKKFMADLETQKFKDENELLEYLNK